MPVSLYDPYAGIGSQNPFSGAAVNQSNRFQVAYNCSALGIGVFGGNTAIDVGIWDVTNGAWVYSNTAPTFTQTPQGWWYHQITGPAPLLAGVTYSVIAFYPAGVTWFYDCAAPATGPGLTWVKSAGGGAFEAAGSALADPTGYTGARTHPISVTTDLVSPIDPQAPGGTVTPTQVANDLVSWLADTNDNTHRYNSSVPGLPDIINRATLELLGRTAIPGAAAGSTLGGIAVWIWDHRTELLEAYNHIRNFYQAAPDATNPYIDLNVLTLLGRTSTLIASDTAQDAALTNIQADLATLLAAPPPDTEALREQLQLTPDPATDARWVLADTATGTGWGEVTTGADMYRLAVTPGTGSRPGTTFPSGITFYRYLGNYAVVRDGYAMERRKLEWSASDIRIPPHFMHGLLIMVGPADDWSCECWQLDR